jgi:hypothetical protein
LTSCASCPAFVKKDLELYERKKKKNTGKTGGNEGMESTSDIGGEARSVFADSDSGSQIDDDDSEELSDDYEDVFTVKSAGPLLREESWNHFDKAFNSFDDKQKWKLRSGRAVEDVLYKFGKACGYEHLAHSFTIDPKDPEIAGLFNDDELEEINSTNKKEDPKIDADTLDYIKAFKGKNTIEEIREVMTSHENRRGKNFDRKKYFSIDTITYIIHGLILLYEENPIPFMVEQTENWYNVNIWGPIIGRPFGDMNGVSVVWGESSSVASSYRKNIGRSRKTRKSMGRRGDLIVRKRSSRNDFELGAGEAGKRFSGEAGTKRLVEGGLKLPKMLRDMFINLCNRVDSKLEIVRQIETIGYTTGGSVLEIMSLDNPSGYITRITRGDILEIPEEVLSFSKALKLIATTLNAKMRIERTVKYTTEVEANLDEIGLYKLAINQLPLPKSLGTPKGKKSRSRSILSSSSTKSTKKKRT